MALRHVLSCWGVLCAQVDLVLGAVRREWASAVGLTVIGSVVTVTRSVSPPAGPGPLPGRMRRSALCGRDQMAQSAAVGRDGMVCLRQPEAVPWRGRAGGVGGTHRALPGGRAWPRGVAVRVLRASVD